ncbi:putative HTH-type transcriptional repressor ExuR [Candidatus Izimaplasma bacterium HR1]|jgi:LacI family transcriptional regulator|uniref:LacI family DNA-binding transcriptional regulator n=1 Tax=Candidatus Izimoplasma sp. HR1 TaxID=1541959 RepID=UPI0004F900F0|nr:putative HTH-type transcriptional repressor ExuR [Candidatus Izimaplasma bacterium HR1]
MVTIKDVAKKSGYSITTVSKALNDYSDISDKTKKHILKLCKELGYVPNSSARSLISKKSYTIGVIFDEVTGVGLQHPLYSKILESFKLRVESQGYDVMFISKQGSYLQHSQKKQVEAVFVLCADFESNDLKKLLESEIPVCVIDHESSMISSVTSNNKKGVNLVIKKLTNLGHKKIAHIYGDLNQEIGRKRKEYFEKAMIKSNLVVKADYLISGDHFSIEEGYNAMNHLLELDDKPTAIFCASDMLAIGAIQAINDEGLSVPKDFSIVGFDGIDLAQLISPRLSTIKQDTYKIGQIAANQIIQMINDKEHRQLKETITVDVFSLDGETTAIRR